MSSAELTDWMAADRLGLIPDVNAAAAMICSVLCNLFGDRRRRAGRAWEPRDFLPDLTNPDHDHDQADAAELAEQIATARRLAAMWRG